MIIVLKKSWISKWSCGLTKEKNHGYAPDKYVRREFDPIRTSFVGKLLYDKIGSKVTNLGIQNVFCN
jgi:hypothetical protein